MKNKIYSSDHISRALGIFAATVSLIIFVSAFTKMTWGIAFIFTYALGLAGYWVLLPLMLIHGLAVLFAGEKVNKKLSWKIILGVILVLIGISFIFGYRSAKYYSKNSLDLFDFYGTYDSGLKGQFAKGKGIIDVNNGGGILFTWLSSLLNSVSDALTITLFVITILSGFFLIFYPFIMRFAHSASQKYALNKIRKRALKAQKECEEEERKHSLEEQEESYENYDEENGSFKMNDEINEVNEQPIQENPKEIQEEPVLTRSSLYHSETPSEVSPVPQEVTPVEPINFSDETFDTSLKEAVFNLNGTKEPISNNIEKTNVVSKPRIVEPTVPNFNPTAVKPIQAETRNNEIKETPIIEKETTPVFNFEENNRENENYRENSYRPKPIEPIQFDEPKPAVSSNQTIMTSSNIQSEQNVFATANRSETKAEIMAEQPQIKEEQISFQEEDVAPIPATKEMPKQEERTIQVRETIQQVPQQEPKKPLVQDNFIDVPETEKEVKQANPAPVVKEPEPEDPFKGMPKAKERPPYEFPPIELLRTIPKDPQVEAENAARCAIRMETINQAISAFGIGAQVVSFTAGPSVTRYDIQFQPGVRASTLNSYISDICRSLGGLNARYEEVIMGKTTSGLEIPNDKSTTVSFKELITAMPTDPKSSMMIPFGVNISGEKMFADLSKFPHMLIAGGTGSGKSVYANSVLATLIMRNRPEDLKLVLIDPKKVEMTKYKDIPHLLCPIITEPSQAKVCLDKLNDEMERRYDIFAKTGAKDIRTFNSKYAPKANLEPMPFIVVFIDEYANLVDSNKAVSDPVAQIAAKARAAGIHLIVATQRPSVNVITGTIKANLDVRVALKVNASQDSQTVIGRGGAEQLNGNGDMLVQCSLISKGGDFIRCQGCFLQDEEIDAIVDYVKSQQKVAYDPYFSDLVDHSQDAKIAEENDKMERAAQRAAEKSDRYEMIKADIMCQEYTSISKIQRNYGMGYPMAQKVFARLQAEGIVAQAESQSSSKGAKVLVHDDQMYRDGSESFYGDND